MSELFSGVGVFILIALTIINLLIYHTVFSVTYFGNLGRHFIREVITAWIVAVLEMALIGSILVKVFGVVSVVLIFLLKILLAVFAIISVVYICKTLKKAYHYNEEGITSENKASRVLKRIWNIIDYLVSLSIKGKTLFAFSVMGVIFGVAILGSLISGAMKEPATTPSATTQSDFVQAYEFVYWKNHIEYAMNLNFDSETSGTMSIERLDSYSGPSEYTFELDGTNAEYVVYDGDQKVYAFRSIHTFTGYNGSVYQTVNLYDNSDAYRFTLIEKGYVQYLINEIGYRPNSSDDVMRNKFRSASSENDNSEDQEDTQEAALKESEEISQYTMEEWEDTWIKEEGPLTILKIQDTSVPGGFLFSINVGASDDTAFVNVSDCQATWNEAGKSAEGDIEYRPVAFTMDGDELIVEEKMPVSDGIPLSGRYVKEDAAINYPCEYVFAESDTALIEQNDLINKTVLECRIAKNEIYARHGRKFNDESLQNYFNTCSWYDGETEPEDFDEQVLNDIELENLNILSEYQDRIQYW